MQYTYTHSDGTRYNTITLGVKGPDVPIDDEGIFEVPADVMTDDLRERIESAGHTPVDVPDDEETAAEPVTASEFDEDELVAMGRNELRSIAAHYDDINGNASGDKLTEDLIAKRRDEVG